MNSRKQHNTTKQKVVIYGGNGFVGTHAAQSIAKLGGDVVCISRSGHKPLYLKDQKWSHDVRWCKGDATQPCPELLSTAHCMVISVGSAPIPTWSKSAYDEQLFTNGIACVNTIEAALGIGIKKIILLSAQIPWLLRTDKFAYFEGKRMAKEAARKFSQTSSEHRAIVLKPGMITGKRVLKNGKHLRLDLCTAPFSTIMPWQFVSVERVANRIADATLNQDSYSDQYVEISNREI